MKKKRAPLGIIGDGQLALMLGEAAFSQGFDFLGFGEDPESPFARAFPAQFVYAPVINLVALLKFAGQCSVLTLENEFLPAELLAEVQKKSGTSIIPSPESYRHFASKLDQREFYDSLGIPGSAWVVAKKNTDQILTQIHQSFHFPLVLKASQGGYDGYGVRMVDTENQLAQALQDLGLKENREILIEEKVQLKMELAQGALFDGLGGMILLPLVETVQKNGICEFVLSKPRLTASLLKDAKEQIESYLQKISKTPLVGLFNFEFFLTEAGSVLINEGAPRPHNSQHLSLNASLLSQFDLLVRFLMTGTFPDTPTPIESRPGLMLNLLGKSTGANYHLVLPPLPETLESYPKLYQKKECRVGRKMGHLNLIDPSGALDLVEIGEKILKDYQL